MRRTECAGELWNFRYLFSLKVRGMHLIHSKSESPSSDSSSDDSCFRFRFLGVFRADFDDFGGLLLEVTALIFSLGMAARCFRFDSGVPGRAELWVGV